MTAGLQDPVAFLNETAIYRLLNKVSLSEPSFPPENKLS
jgi:hypothetical protein